MRQSFIEATGALALKMRIFAAERDEGLPVVAFVHGAEVSFYPLKIRDRRIA